MDFDQHTVCEKIINEIDAVFHKDPDLCTFDIIPLPSHQNTNKSPIVHEQHHLGLESWCVQHVYEYAHNTILAGSRPPCVRAQRPQSPAKPAAQSTDQTIKYLNTATLINPDVATYWNIRRKLFVRNRLNIGREFQFSAIVLSKKPKSNEAFFYRRWLFSFQSGESIDWTIELALCERCADKSASNYHAWCHRQWVLQKAPYLLQYEARLTEKFIRKHIGDYSGYNHRQHVLNQMLATGCHEERQKLLIADYRALCDYVELTVPLARRPETIDALLDVLLPAERRSEWQAAAQYRRITLLYCLNLAAYDLRMCDELTDMYGYREAFNGHRRSALQFIVTQCAAADGAARLSPQPPLRKMAKRCTTHDADASSERDDSAETTVTSSLPEEHGTAATAAAAAATTTADVEVSRLVDGMRLAEAKRGAMHRKWCTLFLAFDFSDCATNNETGNNEEPLALAAEEVALTRAAAAAAAAAPAHVGQNGNDAVQLTTAV